MTDHPLDNPAWHSLGTEHAHLDIGTPPVRRYATEVSPFAAVRDVDEDSLSALRDCVLETGVALFAILAENYPTFTLLPGLQAVWDRAVIQMVFEGDPPDAIDGYEIELLGADDAAEMLALALFTKPGPFAAQTHTMGRYWGVRREGHLIAMAGERMRLPGYTEISAICTHPDHQGKGIGRALTIHAIRAILDRGSLPFLHAFSDNAPAVALYEKLGFRWRQEFRGMQLQVAFEGTESVNPQNSES